MSNPSTITRLSVKPHVPQQSWVKKLGPGLIRGAADDDPSGIATYSQAGAQFGPNLLWTMFFTYPLMVGIQIVSARIGRVTGKGLAGNIRQYYPHWLVYAIVGLLLVADTINIAADVSAMGDALALLIGGPGHLYAAGFGIISLLLQIFIPYSRYVRVLKWLTLALLAYVAVIFTVNIPWQAVGTALVMPTLTWDAATITTIVAVFGTTISPYLFFWQASQEVEELEADPNAQPLILAPHQARANFRRIKIDTVVGMGFSNFVAFFIILTTAVSLHMHGVTNIQTSAEAATALKPIAGHFAFLLFAAGITAVSTLIGIGLGFAPIDPIKALYWSAVINGVISVPIMLIMMLMASRTDVMGSFVISVSTSGLVGWQRLLWLLPWWRCL